MYCNLYVWIGLLRFIAIMSVLREVVHASGPGDARCCGEADGVHHHGFSRWPYKVLEENANWY